MKKFVLLFCFALMLAQGAVNAQNKLAFSIPFTLVDNRPFIKVKIKQQTFHFILDCGAINAMNLACAKQLGLPLTNPSAQSGAGAKQVQSWHAAADTVHIGPKSVYHIDYTVIDLSEIRQKLHLPYLDGIVGYTFMKDYAVQFDYPAGMINFYNSYGAKQAIPFDMYGHIPQIKATIDGIPALLIVDTGDRTALTVFGHYADKHQMETRYTLSDTTITGYGIGGPILARTFKLNTLQIGHKVVKNVASRIPTLKIGGFAATDIDGSIGGGVLKQYKFTIDYIKSVMYFE